MPLCIQTNARYEARRQGNATSSSIDNRASVEGMPVEYRPDSIFFRCIVTIFCRFQDMVYGLVLWSFKEVFVQANTI